LFNVFLRNITPKQDLRQRVAWTQSQGSLVLLLIVLLGDLTSVLHLRLLSLFRVLPMLPMVMAVVTVSVF